MHHDKRTAKRPGYAARGIALLAVAVGLATTAGTVWAGTGPDVDPVPAPSASIKPVAAKPGFYETYRGHHIMGWGANEKACAYIDGVPLVLYPSGDGQYTSNLAAFELKSSVRAITRASVKTLGKLPPAVPSDAPAHCPALVVRKPAKPVPAPKK
ncbi:tyrosinase family oxidase copper chaperone [Actinoplanes sp. NPDC026670]|uniref:tyrosinase family oxidase copper chaperone n=1 Tax=Actinoplanes sp. NPDC026670 TaxID=3154700 RepID=UPI0033C7FC92